MVGKVNFRIEGGKELEAALKELGPGLARNVGARAVRAAMKPIADEAKRLVPKDTRKLERSITIRKERERGGAYAATQTVFLGFKKPRSRIAHLLEFGTSKMAARPFIRPAFDSKSGEALTIMAETLARGIARQEWKKTLGFLAEGGELDFGDSE